MGAWIWRDMVERLRDWGFAADTLTLPGCSLGATTQEASRARLAEHVDAVVAHLNAAAASLKTDAVVLVAHSYSGVVVGQVADRYPAIVRRSIHVGSFLPQHGRSMLDDFSDSEDLRSAERQQVVDAGYLWAAPPIEALAMESDMSESQQRWLHDRFVPHPGHTVLDPAVMRRPVATQRATYIATASTGTDPTASLPPMLGETIPASWTLRTMSGGHWPMVTRPDELASVVRAEALR
jgi:pimeloyl-ACP methyl ester carboxylesterase